MTIDANAGADRSWCEVGVCALCLASGAFRELYWSRDWHYGNGGEFRIVECPRCTLAFMDPMPSPALLASFYPSDYVPYQSPLAVPSGLKAVVIKVTMPGVGTTGDPDFDYSGYLLDVGCGSGNYLLRARAKGWQVKGVELSPQAAEQGRAHGLDIFCGTLQEARLPGAAFDYVRLNHVFEHLLDPNETLQEIKRILRPGGKLFIGVPNRASLAARVFKEYWYQLAPPVHIFHWSPKTLAMILEKNGFRVERTRFNSDYTGLTSSLQIYRKRHLAQGNRYDVGPVGKILGYWAAKGTDLLQRGDSIEVISTLP